MSTTRLPDGFVKRNEPSSIKAAAKLAMQHDPMWRLDLEARLAPPETDPSRRRHVFTGRRGRRPYFAIIQVNEDGTEVRHESSIAAAAALGHTRAAIQEALRGGWWSRKGCWFYYERDGRPSEPPERKRWPRNLVTI